MTSQPDDQPCHDLRRIFALAIPHRAMGHILDGATERRRSRQHLSDPTNGTGLVRDQEPRPPFARFAGTSLAPGPRLEHVRLRPRRDECRPVLPIAAGGLANRQRHRLPVSHVTFEASRGGAVPRARSRSRAKSATATGRWVPASRSFSWTLPAASSSPQMTAKCAPGTSGSFELLAQLASTEFGTGGQSGTSQVRGGCASA